MARKTLADVKAMTCDMLTPAIVGDVLRCDPHFIRCQARDFPETLGFPTCLIGSRVKIPRIAFIKWCEGTDGSVAFIKVSADKAPVWRERLRIDAERAEKEANWEKGLRGGTSC
ncbi:MAG: hypothetical protein IJR54_00805 [Oscillibacter sp.]|nr:hypothetical protein [Oscillibacter sp.]